MPTVFAALRNSSNGGILVGGQSLVFWADFLDIQIPKTDQPYLTQDADIFGTAKDAHAVAASLLSAKVFVPDIGDSTPNTATISYKTPDDRLLYLDFLGNLVGLKDQEIVKRAVSMLHVNYGQLTVLHPRHVVISRISNLHILETKRTTNGVSQAQIAIPMIRSFFDYYYDQNPTTDKDRYYLECYRWVFETSLTKAGIYCYQNWGIDLMQAAPINRITAPRFHSEHEKNSRAYLQEKREKTKF